MSRFPDVRLATEADRPGILNLCRMLHEENGIFPLEMTKVEEVLDRAFQRDFTNPVVIGVVGTPAELKGCICIAIHSFWYANKETPCCDELFNFVHPGHRKSDYAKQQIEFAKEIANTWGLPLMVGVLSNERTEAKVRLYERMLPKAGAYFVYYPQAK